MAWHISGVAASFDVFRNLGIAWCNVFLFWKNFEGENTLYRGIRWYGREEQVIPSFASTFPCCIVWYGGFHFSVPRNLGLVVPRCPVLGAGLGCLSASGVISLQLLGGASLGWSAYSVADEGIALEFVKRIIYYCNRVWLT